MSIRISTLRATEAGIETLQKRQVQLAESQERLTSGKRVDKASDDPAAAARAERALAGEMRATTSQRAVDASRTAMSLSETAMGDAVELLQQARETMVAAGNATYSDEQRKNLSEKLKAIRDQLMSVANRTDGAGTYLFGGQGTQAPPFIDNPGGVAYQGTGGNATVPSGEPLPMSVDGRRAWLQARDPDTATDDLSVFNVLDRVIGELSSTGVGGAQVKQFVTEGLKDVDAVTENLLAARAAAGEVLNRTDGIEGRIADSKLAAQTERSNAEDLDMVQAVSDFQNRQSGYDAALKTYSMVQRLSLFQYLSG